MATLEKDCFSQLAYRRVEIMVIIFGDFSIFPQKMDKLPKRLPDFLPKMSDPSTACQSKVVICITD
jgi:hypothetical protein